MATRVAVSKVPAFVFGIILSILGLVIYWSTMNRGRMDFIFAVGTYGSCCLLLTGILVIIVALLRPRESIDLNSSETGNMVSIPPPSQSD